ncbi:MAG: M56 family metallopeptidase, partial [Lachnospiraceae bacterium]|nr:M56 family metallopeptidase [Lachnospiraceae bacterium]
MNGLDGMLEMISLPGRSFVAAILISFLIVIRALLLHRLPKLTFQAAWAVVILRLLLPVSVSVFPADGGNGIPLFSAFLTEAPDGGDGEDGGEQAVSSKDTKAADGAPGQARDGGHSLYGSASEREEQPAGNFGAAGNAKTAGAGLYPVLRGIWFAGMLSVLLYFLCSHFRARRIYAAALPVEHDIPEVDFHGKWKLFRRRVQIRVSDRISAPVTCGIVSPVILLPKTTDWDNSEQLRMVLEHEAVHIRRFDIVYKWLLAAAAALHWFNPLVWAMYYLADRDIELSCDEAVIRKLGSCKRQDYALALLNFEEKRMLSPTASGFGGSAVRERIEAIMKINKKSTIAMALAVLLIAGTTTVFAGARESKNNAGDQNDFKNSSVVKQYI